MNKIPNNNEPLIDLNNKFVAFSGWLIFPAIYSLLTFLGALIMVIFVNPYELIGFDLYIYLMDFFFIPFLLIIYYLWFKRKRLFPKMIMLFFLINAIWNVAYYVAGFQINLLNLSMSIAWFLYFLRSKRVKTIFTY